MKSRRSAFATFRMVNAKTDRQSRKRDPRFPAKCLQLIVWPWKHKVSLLKIVEWSFIEAKLYEMMHTHTHTHKIPNKIKNPLFGYSFSIVLRYMSIHRNTKSVY